LLSSDSLLGISIYPDPGILAIFSTDSAEEICLFFQKRKGPGANKFHPGMPHSVIYPVFHQIFGALAQNIIQ
jgi:hypothetical protein